MLRQARFTTTGVALPRRTRLTTAHLMVLVCGLAMILGLGRAVGGPVLALISVELTAGGLIAAWSWGHRRLAARGLGLSAVVSGLIAAWLCVYRVDLAGLVGVLMLALVTGPMTLGFGAAWAQAATRPGAAPRRSAWQVAPIVLALALIVPSMLATLWPLRLAFAVSAPALAALADRVAAGTPPPWPARAGLYRVVGARRALDGTGLALLIDDNPAGASGFVRMLAPGEATTAPPMANLNVNEPLGGGWWYQNED